MVICERKRTYSFPPNRPCKCIILDRSKSEVTMYLILSKSVIHGVTIGTRSHLFTLIHNIFSTLPACDGYDWIWQRSPWDPGHLLCNFVESMLGKTAGQRDPDSKVHGAHLGPTGPRRAPCWPHELCYLGKACLTITLLWLLCCWWILCTQ